MTPLALCVSLLLSADPVSVAVTELRGAGVPADKIAFFSEHVARSMAVPGLNVLSPHDLTTLLGMERQRQLAGCSEQGGECLTELSDALGAAALLAGDLARLDDGFRFSLKLTQRNGGAIAQRTGTAANEQALADELARAARQLSAELLLHSGRGDEAKAVVESGPTLRSRAWLPLAGGALVAALGAGLWAGSLGPAAQLRNASHLSLGDAAAQRDLGSGLQTSGAVCVAVGGAAIVAGVVMAVLGGPKTVVTSVGVSGSGASLNVGGTF